jgi:hypothetical protein
MKYIAKNSWATSTCPSPTDHNYKRQGSTTMEPLLPEKKQCLHMNLLSMDYRTVMTETFHQYTSMYQFFKWTTMCPFRLLLWVKHFPHTEHAYGFSPVWIILWCFKLHLWAKRFPQISHSCGLSPVWVSMCASSFVKVLLQIVQKCLSWLLRRFSWNPPTPGWFGHQFEPLSWNLLLPNWKNQQKV